MMKNTTPKLGLSQIELEMFQEIGQVMKKYKNKMNRKFGLCLIHQHFEIKNDEILHEENNPIERTHTTTVVKKGEMKHSRPTQWELN